MLAICRPDGHIAVVLTSHQFSMTETLAWHVPVGQKIPRAMKRSEYVCKTPGGTLRTSPFDDEDGTFYALVNDELQYSLWPVFAGVPDGWHVVHGSSAGASRESCLEFIEANWTDMRPKSLQDAMGGDIAAR